MQVKELSQKVLSRLSGRMSSHREFSNPADEQPLRSELFSVEQLGRHAKIVATSHKLVKGRIDDKLLSRLGENEHILIGTYDLLTAAASQNQRIELDAEWLLDNFYLVEEQIRSIRRLLPPSFSRQLPHLASGPAASFPRVYGIALELISHVDGRIDPAGLHTFIASYQTVESLKLGELWALPLMLRLGLIENLRRVAIRIATARRDRDLAASWAERMVNVVDQRPTDLILVLADMARANPPLSGAFLSELTRHLQGQNPSFALAHTWVEHRLAELGFTTENVIREEGQAQAADQVSIGNSINSLRFLDSSDWRDFVDEHSLVERTLGDDPSGVYPRMDFATRDRYRHAVEAISRRSQFSEYEVARKAVQLAEDACREKPCDRASHIGFYLVDGGRQALERQVSMRVSPGVILDRIRRRIPLTCYLAIILVVTLFTAMAFLLCLQSHNVSQLALVLLSVPVLFSASRLGIGIANWLAIQFLSPKSLPRMNFETGIPPDHRTLVAIPTMLTNTTAIEHLIEGLEVRYLANRDPNLHFALLTDFVDADVETRPGDEDLVRSVREGIEKLNEKYAAIRKDIFYLFHRSRQRNLQEEIWMGRERKRGKLADLNATLRGAKGRFIEVVGEVQALQDVRYIITLDTDTQLPRDAARHMVGTLAHWLNQPIIDEKRGLVVEGYTILQPRVGASLPSALKSRYSQWNTDDPGIDPYTRVVSDVYQDLFGEGSFIGKGIYDIDSFEAVCSNFPDNAILSHDLIEGAYCRSALLSDVTLSEEHPSSYLGDIARRHRWIRGDWQIAGWLLPWVRGQNGQRIRNPISELSQWKIFDNLRRSVVPIAMLFVMLLTWFFAPTAAGAALLFLAVITLLPTLLDTAGKLIRKPVDLPISLHLRATLSSLKQPLVLNGLELVFLPFEALVNADAILRTLYRMGWSKRRLLEWKTSSDSDRGANGKLQNTFLGMMFGPALAASTLLALVFYPISLQAIAGPILAAWAISPVVAWWLSLPIPRRKAQLSESQQVFLEKLSRKTWRYFEEFVSKTDHWLPPDNIQINPDLVIAPRTSPTNIGMALLADLSAYDFGYCSAGQLLTRTQQTFATLSRMERYRGHFFNWYDTRTLTPLPPHYVSMVDSGNLAANLLVLKNGFQELGEGKIVPARIFGGLRDTLRVLLDVARESDNPLVRVETLRLIERQIDILSKPPLTLGGVHTFLSKLVLAAGEIRAAGGDIGEFSWWAAAYERNCKDHIGDLLFQAGWTGLQLPPPSPRESQATNPGSKPGVQGGLTDLQGRLDQNHTIREVAQFPSSLIPLLDSILAESGSEMKDWLLQLRGRVLTSAENASARIQSIGNLVIQCDELADMDFGLLYNSTRDLFAIGYNVSDRRLDASFYDLLASEARLASFLVIADGNYDQTHWFALGRLLTSEGNTPALLSWSGSMFEYLMPLLVMPNYENTLLDRTYQAIVRRQIEYGRQRGVPWGISESGYNMIDQHKTYQYRAFGVPGLGLKRGLAEDLVIAPYASALALMVEPEAACRNLERLNADGQQGPYGFFEAIDYTPSRLPPGTDKVTVRQFMAHHEGMSLLSLAYLLLDKPMQRRFLADPMFRAAELLLQERVPKAAAPVFPHATEANATRLPSAEVVGNMQVFTDPNSPAIEAHLLSNGRYHVAITSAGGGYSRWRDLAVTRWREDSTRDNHGSFCYIRDLESGSTWSNAWQPTTKFTTGYEAIFTQARAEFRRIDSQIETYTQISVSPEDDIELRRVTLTNRSDSPRTIEVTTYAEVVMATQAQDEAHPAFSNLFVQTELVPKHQAIFCARRPRSAEERPPWLGHMLKVRGLTQGAASYETDRMKFIGRQRTLSSPAAFDETDPLSNSEGSVLDPIVSIRQAVVLQPNEMVRIDLVTGVAETRQGIESLIEKYGDPSLTDRVFDLAWTHSHILLRQLGASEADARIYGRLAGSIIYGSSLRRAKASILSRNRQGQSGLWGYGISGDLPIVLIRVRDHEQIALVRQAVQAHAYWRLKGLAVDLVIWNEDESVYRQPLQEAISDLVAASPEASLIDRPGGIYIRRGEQMSDDDRSLLQAVARIVFLDDGGTFAEQAERRSRSEVTIPNLIPLRNLPKPVVQELPERHDLAFFNGLGGFSQDGREYIMIFEPGKATPAPWVNVIANPQFGTVVSEGGGAYTWAENSHQFRVTPWNNDPVSDTSGEAIYLRDDDSGRFWSPTPLPARGNNTYITRHGFGYSIFDSTEDGITTELCVYVAPHDPVKFFKLKITNHSGRPRQLSATAYCELVLGDTRSKSVLHIVTESDPASGAILARNVYSPEFGSRVAFLNCSEATRSLTGDRTEFIGRNGKLASPAAMRRIRLSGRVGAGYDPCAAIQAPIQLADGQERTITFTIGAGRGATEAKSLAQRFRSVESAHRAIEGVWDFWSRTLGVVYLETPDQAINFLGNGWLVYQTLACRMWARSGFYQSGGAFGFRDQLQDAMALVHAQPHLLREHLLRASAHQFIEGDVQHWWHPPLGRGVRTQFSDDYLWLPLALCRYVQTTGDTGILDEKIPFLKSRLLKEEEESYYDLPQISDDIGTLYEHGIRAIKRGLRFGQHGLPLMGCGDWNDGMNLVGQHGKGESVWLGFFLFHVLTQFSLLARQHGDGALADQFTVEAGRLRGNIEEHAWDGDWYRRAYFDDGTPLGSALNEECQIDAISQSWSVLSGAGTNERSTIAMENLDKRLIKREDRLILLLDPPFDKSDLNPGYIKGYVPGVRENGGQYTHSAIWTVMATAAMGETEKAWDLLSMINPISHGSTPEEVAIYRAEPYVVAADVYGTDPHTGRGGWTWYTGSAGWMYRLIIESLLGLDLEVDKLRISPKIPSHWKHFKIHYRYRETFYHISIHNHGVSGNPISLTLDGNLLTEDFVTLIDDRQNHEVNLEINKP